MIFNLLIQRLGNLQIIPYQEAGKAIGDQSKGGNIAACVNGNQKTCKGYIWKTEYKLKRGSL